MTNRRLTSAELAKLTRSTLRHYETRAADFWEGTKGHDVSQNVQALVDALARPRADILDLGCGPGRDVAEFIRLGYNAVGLDGCKAFVRMAERHSGATILHQDFLSLELPIGSFDGVFANASLFHVPTQELPRVLRQIWACLRADGVLFSSNPRGANQEGYSDARYGAYHDKAQWWRLLNAAGFEPITHYYRPPGLPRAEQPWLASLWAKVE